MREDIDTMQQVLAVNTMGVAASFHPFIAPMVRRGSGQLVGIASVAGLRGCRDMVLIAPARLQSLPIAKAFAVNCAVVA